MLVDSDFTQKYKMGTSMFSRSGVGMSINFNNLNTNPPKIAADVAGDTEQIDLENITSETSIE